MERHYDISIYSYCSNNPINYVAPFGLDVIKSRNLFNYWLFLKPKVDVVLLNGVTVTPNSLSNI